MKMLFSRLGVARGILLGLMLVGLYVGFRPEPPPYLFTDGDKLLHFVFLFGVVVMARLAFPQFRLSYLSILALSFAVALESAQDVLQPTRVFAWEDVIANVSGASCAVIFLALLGRFRAQA